MLAYTPEVSVCLHELCQCLQELNCSSSMTSSIASSAEADLTQVIPMLVDGIAQEIAERREMKVTFVADHKQHDLSSWKLLKDEIMHDVRFIWQRPNDLNHPRPYFVISLANEGLLMNPINTTNEMVPKDIKGSGAYTDPGQPAALWRAGSYGSALSTLRTKLLAAMEGQFTTKAAPRLSSVVQFQLGTHPNRMAPPDWIGSPLALEAFLHLRAWHAKYPKDSGNKYCLELNTHSAGVHGIAFELNTVLHRQWRYDMDWLKKLREFDLLSHYKKRQLCESALQSLEYDPKRIPIVADPGYGHSQLDTSGEADAQDYDAQINALMDGGVPPSFRATPSSSGTSSSSLSGGFGFSSGAAPPTAKAMPRSSTATTCPCPTSQQGGQANKIRKIQDVMQRVLTPTPSDSKYRRMPPVSQQAFAFLPATEVSPSVFFSLTWRKSDQGWKTSATPPYSNLIRDVRNRRPDNEVLHIQLYASDLAMLPFHSRLIWLIPFPAEWSWLPTWCPGVMYTLRAM